MKTSDFSNNVCCIVNDPLVCLTLGQKLLQIQPHNGLPLVLEWEYKHRIYF